MTDEELSVSDATLIAWLREADDRGDGDLAMVHCAHAADRIEALVKERDAAVEAKLDAIDTLNNWFDRRKLGHDAVDQAVIDAASGYLRTSRVGGMSPAESDLILGVVQDMARLGLFADLFARAALKGADHE